MVRLWQAPRPLGAWRRIRESGFAANHPPAHESASSGEPASAGKSAHPRNHAPPAIRLVPRIIPFKRIGSVEIIAATGASRDPPRRFCPSRESPTRGESAPIRRIGPLWQVGLPKDSRSAGDSGASGSSRPPGPAGIRFGDSARPANHPLGANRRPSGKLVHSGKPVRPRTHAPPTNRVRRDHRDRRGQPGSVPAIQPVPRITHSGRIGTRPANLSPLASRPAQGPTPRWRIGPVGIIATAGVSRDPFRRIGPFRESPHGANRRPFGESVPSGKSACPRTRALPVNLVRRDHRGRRGQPGSAPANRPAPRITPSGRTSTHRANLPRHLESGAWPPVRAARQARGRPWPALAP